MKNGKKLGKVIAGGIIRFGKGAQEAYAEEYGKKPTKHKAVKKVKAKSAATTKDKKTLHIRLFNPLETISDKWEVWWGVEKLTQHKDFATRPPATKYMTKLKTTWRAKGYKIDYKYVMP